MLSTYTILKAETSTGLIAGREGALGHPAVPASQRRRCCFKRQPPSATLLLWGRQGCAADPTLRFRPVRTSRATVLRETEWLRPLLHSCDFGILFRAEPYSVRGLRFFPLARYFSGVNILGGKGLHFHVSVAAESPKHVAQATFPFSLMRFLHLAQNHHCLARLAFFTSSPGEGGRESSRPHRGSESRAFDSVPSNLFL